MRARIAFVNLFVCLAVTIPSAWAGVPMGPTMPVVEKGQWAVGIEYAYEKIDVEAEGTCTQSILGGLSEKYSQQFMIDSMKTSTVFGRIEYALCQDWEVFARLGASNGDAEIRASGPGVIIGGRGGEVGYDGSYGFAGGIGTRATFYQSGPWRIEGLAQVTWLDPGDSDFRIINPEDPTESVAGNAKIDYLLTQVGVSAVYRVNAWSFWAGPFFQMIDGDLDMDADFITDGTTLGQINCNGDISEDSKLGVTLGADCEVNRNFIAWIEGQLTGDSWMVSVGGILHPDHLLGEW